MSYDYGYGYDYGDSVGSAVGAGLGAALGIVIFIWIIAIAISVFSIICNWKVYKKAGKQGWESIIPIYNIIVLLQITGQPVWYIALYLIPGVGALIANILIYLELSKKFGQSTGFGIGLALLNPIFMAILAFNKNYVYQGSSVNNMQPNYNQPVNNMAANNIPVNNESINNNPIPLNNNQVVNNAPTQGSNCQACGAPVNPGDKFCMSCGKQL